MKIFSAFLMTLLTIPFLTATAEACEMHKQMSKMETAAADAANPSGQQSRLDPQASDPLMTAMGTSETMIADLKITEAWTRQTPPNAMAAGAYLTITNTGSESDRLIGGQADFANVIEIHDMTMKDGVMRMFPIDGLEIKPGESVDLKPGSYHVMMIDITKPFKHGDTVTITLDFEKAGSVDVAFPVARLGAKKMGHHH